MKNIIRVNGLDQAVIDIPVSLVLFFYKDKKNECGSVQLSNGMSVITTEPLSLLSARYNKIVTENTRDMFKMRNELDGDSNLENSFANT